MTFWSRHDPASQPQGSTDHWSKMKIRATASAGRMRVHDTDMMSSWLPERSFTNVVADNLYGTPMSDDPMSRSRVQLPPLDLRNSYHDRAKEGFRYWLIGRPQPTTFGKYGMGSSKTVLGIGNAPRT